MAKLISVEKSKYIDENINLYSKIKVGQYSKYLNKNPIFVTYYHINQQLTRADVGTGGIQSELGGASPIRFNKIIGFPIYNLPELKPDVTFDETGWDIDMELSDIVVLPNTIKPTPGDYMLLVIPNTKEVLFRVNHVRYNTIQSNDFYTIDIDIKDIGNDLENSRVLPQVVETYQTIFDNIGTQDKCFIRTSDVDKINSLVKTLSQLKDLYKEIFYNIECNSFVLYNNLEGLEEWLYDPYIESFITKSNIYYDNTTEAALVLTPNDILPINFEYQFKRTLLYAVLNRTMDYINPYNYFYQSSIAKTFSPFNVYSYPCNGVHLYISNSQLTDGSSNSDGYDLEEYSSSDLVAQIKNGVLTSTDYLDMIIYNFMLNIPMEIEKDKLLEYTYDHSRRMYLYIPIIMYIITKYYDEYFVKENIDIV